MEPTADGGLGLWQKKTQRFALLQQRRDTSTARTPPGRTVTRSYSHAGGADDGVTATLRTWRYLCQVSSSAVIAAAWGVYLLRQALWTRCAD
jgi:hypothetical protein